MVDRPLYSKQYTSVKISLRLIKTSTVHSSPVNIYATQGLQESDKLEFSYTRFWFWFVFCLILRDFYFDLK